MRFLRTSSPATHVTSIFYLLGGGGAGEATRLNLKLSIDHDCAYAGSDMIPPCLPALVFCHGHCTVLSQHVADSTSAARTRTRQPVKRLVKDLDGEDDRAPPECPGMGPQKEGCKESALPSTQKLS
jgi:hypothetical protein